MSTPFRFDGVRPSPPDHRDFPVKAFLPVQAEVFPEEFLLPFLPPFYNQYSTSMCVDFSIRTTKESQEWQERGTFEPLANGYIYGNRQPGDYEGEGLYPREALNTLVKFGLPPASAFNVTGTYEECKAYYAAHKEEADSAAKPQRVRSYVACTTPDEVKGALIHLKSPVLITIAVTRAFAYYSQVDGRIANETKEAFAAPDHIIGCHEMAVVGYKPIDNELHYAVQNSYGGVWGDHGRCYIPATYPGIVELWAVTDVHPTGKRLRLTLDSTDLVLDTPQGASETLTMDTVPHIQDGRTFVPVRFVTDGLAKLLGVKVMVLPVTDECGKVLGVDLVVPDPEA